MNKITFLLVFSILLLNSCTDIMCGKLEKSYQGMVDSSNKKFKGVLIVEPIPCEFNYINVNIVGDTIDKAILDSLHEILYMQEPNEGWVTLDVYNAKKVYLYSHGIKGNLYNRSGD